MLCLAICHKHNKKQWLLTPVQLEQTPEPKLQQTTSCSSGTVDPINTTTTNSEDIAPTKTANELLSKEINADEIAKPPLPPPPEAKGATVRAVDPATMAALGGSHSLVLTASGKVFAFGRQEYGRLGTGTDEVVSRVLDIYR